LKCHKYGHYANRCPGGEEKKGDEAHHSRVENIEPTLMLMVTKVLEPIELAPRAIAGVQQHVVFLDERKVMSELHLTSGVKKAGAAWYLDNGASNHMSGDADKFHDLDAGIVGKVRFGDGSAVEINGMGTLVFQCKNGDQWLLLDVSTSQG
jgi:hypothetical protein